MWYWCRVCMRCYLSNEQRRGSYGMPMCAYLNCTGLALTTLPWHRVQPLRPEFPETPERDVRYPVPELTAQEP